MEKHDMLGVIERLYKARKDGDFNGVGDLIADNADFTFAGHENLARAFPGGEEDELENVARRLNEQLQMTSLKRRDSIAEGNKLFVLWDAEFSYEGSDPFPSPLFDLWEFDEDGKVMRGFQCFDTAILGKKMGILDKLDG